MATGLENYPNIVPADADYLKGDLKDNDGSNNGTPINRLTNADIHQFFVKMLDLAGITASGDPENETNGYQYIEALKAVTNSGIQDEWHYIGDPGEPAFDSGYSNQDPDTKLKFRKDLQGNVTITGVVISTGGPTMFTIPSDYVPAEDFSGAVIAGLDNVGFTNSFLYRSMVLVNGNVELISVYSGGPTPASIVVWVDIKYNIKT